MDQTRKITFELPVELALKFKMVAVLGDRSMADILRDFVEWYVEKEGKGNV
jgi:hypothetical protein